MQKQKFLIKHIALVSIVLGIQLLLGSSPTAQAGESIWLEAECMDIMGTQVDIISGSEYPSHGFSNGYAVNIHGLDIEHRYMLGDPADDDLTVGFDVTVTEGGSYNLWIEADVWSNLSNFKYSINGGARLDALTISDNSSSNHAADYKWNKVNTDPNPLSLSAGTHTIRLRNTDAFGGTVGGLRIDKLLLTNEGTNPSVSEGTAPTCAINASCKVFDGHYYRTPAVWTTDSDSQLSTWYDNGCETGYVSNVRFESNEWRWTCNGYGGGANDTCSANAAVVTESECTDQGSFVFNELGTFGYTSEYLSRIPIGGASPDADQTQVWNVTVENAGNYNLFIERRSMAGTPIMLMSINGAARQEFPIGTTTYRITDLGSFSLNAGVNAIRFGTKQGTWALDKIYASNTQIDNAGGLLNGRPYYQSHETNWDTSCNNFCGNEILEGTEECDSNQFACENYCSCASGYAGDGSGGCQAFCQEDSAYDLTNAQLCTGDGTGLSSAQTNMLRSSCTFSRKCEYVCIAGYEYDAGECVPAYDTFSCGADGNWISPPSYNSCTIQDSLSGTFNPGDTVCRSSTPSNSYCQGYVCQGGPLVNASVCTQDANEDLPPNASTDYQFIADCSMQTNATKCEYTCDPGFFWDGAKCESTNLYSCQLDGTWANIGNGGIAGESFSGSDTRRPNQGNASTIVLFDDVTPPANSQCVPRTCDDSTVTFPTNASLCRADGDDEVPNGSTSYVHMAGCSTTETTKCSFKCNTGYEYADINGDGSYACELQISQYLCNGTSGAWELTGDSCIIPSSNPYSSTPGTIVCAQNIPTSACDAFMCAGTEPDPVSTAICSASTANLPDTNQSRTLATNCDTLTSGEKCRFVCEAGYEDDGAGGCQPAYNEYECGLNGGWGLSGGGNTCTLVDNLLSSYRPGDSVCRASQPSSTLCDEYQCVDVLPTNGSLCGSDETSLISSDGISHTYVTECDTDDTATKCQFECLAGHEYDAVNDICVPIYTSYECLSSGDWSTGSVNTCTSPNYNGGLQYAPGTVVCTDPAVTPTSASCDTFQCTGTPPSNGVICADANTGLTSNTAITTVEYGLCDGTKCQYECPEGYTFDGSACVADFRSYECNASGKWFPGSLGCASDDYIATNPYIPGQVVCTDATTGPSHTTCSVCQDDEQDIDEACEDSNPFDTDACLTTCEIAFCGDGYTYGGVEECDGQVGCTSCVWDAVDCTLSVSSGTIDLGQSIVFTFSKTGPIGMIETPLNFGDGTDEVLSGTTIEHTFTSPGLKTASFTVTNPGIITTNEPLASRVKKVCSVTIDVIGGSCGNGIQDAGESCGEPGLSCPSGSTCNPFVCQCFSVCEEKTFTLEEQCDNGLHCSDGSSCVTNNDCGAGTDGICEIRSGDGCTNLCEDEFCGDGVLQPFEECEWSDGDTSQVCTRMCRFPFCGDGEVYGDDGILGTADDESCDPGTFCEDINGDLINCTQDQSQCADRINGCSIILGSDACTIACESQSACGDQVVDTPNAQGVNEQCDLGSLNSDTGDCRQNTKTVGTTIYYGCTETVCGDGDVQQSNGQNQREQCDDGNDDDTDACSNTCTINDYPVGECAPNEYLATLEPSDVLAGVYDSSLCAGGVISIDGTQLLNGGVVQWTCVDTDTNPLNDNAVTCTLPTCGDGVLDIGETCDDGRHCSDNPNQACAEDTDCAAGTCRPVSEDGCNELCQQEDIIVPIGSGAVGGATCVNPGSYPVVHDDEYLPFRWQGAVADNSVQGTSTCSDAVAGKYLMDTAMCIYGVARFEGLVEVERDSQVISVFKQPCFDATPGIASQDLINNPMLITDALENFGAIQVTRSGGEITSIQSDSLLGASYLVPNATSQGLTYSSEGSPIQLPMTNEIITRDQVGVDSVRLYGQYEIRLLGVEYEYCSREKTYVESTVSYVCDSVDTGALDLDNDGTFTCETTITQPGPLTDVRTIPMYFDMTQGVGTTVKNPVSIPFYSKESQPICRIPFTISKPYFVQRGTTLNEVQSSYLDEVYDLEGNVLNTTNTLIDPDNTSAGQLSTLSASSRTLSGSTNTLDENAYNFLLNAFSEQYEKLAVIEGSVGGGAGLNLINNTKKVPNENIFFYYGSQDVESADIRYLLDYHGVCGPTDTAQECDSFTIVMKREDPTFTSANFNIRGNLNYNAMYLIDGQIHFATDRSSCDTAFDVVDGILLAKGGFSAEKLRNDTLNTERCMKGGLQIRGIMFGAGLDQDLFDMRRSAFSSRDENIFDGNPVQIASDLFNTCYMPTLVMRQLTPAGAIPLVVQTPRITSIPMPIFGSGPEFESYGGFDVTTDGTNNITNTITTVKNEGPISFPAFWIKDDRTFVSSVLDSNGDPINYCNINTYKAYTPIVDAMKTKLVDALYHVCNGDAGLVDQFNSKGVGYCGDGIVQGTESCDYGDNPNLNTDSLRDTYCSSITCKEKIELTFREKANTVNVSAGVQALLQRSGMQVAMGQVDITKLSQTLSERGANAGIPLSCGVTGADQSELTRNRIRRVVDARFEDVRGLFKGLKYFHKDTVSSTYDADEILYQLSLAENYGFINNFSRGFTNINFRAESAGIPLLTKDDFESLHPDGIRFAQNRDRVGSSISLINETIDDGYAFGIGTNTASWSKLPAGADTFLQELLSIKE